MSATDYFQRNCWISHRVRRPLRRRRDPLDGRRPHRVRDRLPAPRLEVPGRHRPLPRPRRRRSCRTTSKRKILWDNAVDLYRFPEGYLPPPRPDGREPMTRDRTTRGRPSTTTRSSDAYPPRARVLRHRVARAARGDRAHAARSGCAARADGGGEGAVLRATLGTTPASTRARSDSLDDLWRAPVVHRRRHPQEHRRAPAVGRLPGRHPGRRAARADARVHVGRHHRASRVRPSTRSGTARSAALLTARALYMQGIRPGDVVLNSWAYGTHNGAFDLRRGAAPLAQLRRAHHEHRQRHEQRAPGASSRSSTARPRSSPPATTCCASPTSRGRWATTRRPTSTSRALPNIGDRELLESTFGVECFNSYGFHEVQWVSVECPAHDGLHIFEDAFVVQIVDPETGEPLPDGELGSICITELYKTGSPQFRYNIMDLSHAVPARAVRVRELAAQDGAVRRPRRQHGEAARRQRVAGGRRRDRARGRRAPRPTTSCARCATSNRDELIVSVASDGDPSQFGRAREARSRRSSRTASASRIAVEVVAPGALDEWTEVGTSPKLKRFRDDR